MIASTLRHCASTAAVGALLISAPCFEAAAADASSWDGDARSAVRLVAGGIAGSSGDILRAGVEIRLAAGWKTYWRYPGDSGVPPRFDFSGSRNVKSVTFAWPAPHRAHDESGTTIVYQDGVIFPLRVVAQDAEKPVELSLKLDYAVCHDICIPKDAKAELALDRKASAL